MVIGTENRKRAQKKYAETHRPKIRAKMKRLYAENKEAYNATSLAWRIAHLDYIMLADARKRAAKFGLPFNLDLFDIEIPVVCPVLGFLLVYGKGGRTDASPSLDKIKPELGYVKGNVAVISWRANRLKSNAKAEELRKIAAYMERQ